MDDTFESFKDICKFASVYLGMNLTCGLPLRGGISKGDVINISKPMNNIMQTCLVGNGIVNAYHSEQQQNWMGVAIDEKCLKGFTEDEYKSLFIDEKMPIVKYSVPIKEFNKEKNEVEQVYKEMHVVDWTIIPELFKGMDKEKLKSYFAQYKKPIEKINDKIDNTYRFFTDNYNP